MMLIDEIINNNPREKWYDLAKEAGCYSEEGRSGTYYIDKGEEETLMFCLIDELKPDCTFPVDNGEILENKETKDLWLVSSIPNIDARNKNINSDDIFWNGNMTMLLKVTSGNIVFDSPEDHDKYHAGYMEDHITDSNFDSKYIRVNDSDPRISDKVKHYQDLFREGKYSEFYDETKYIYVHAKEEQYVIGNE